MIRQEIDAVTGIILAESNMNQMQAEKLARRILEAAEAERAKWMEKTFGPDIVE